MSRECDGCFRPRFPPVVPQGSGKGAGCFWQVETGRSNFSPDEIVTSVLGAVTAKKEEGQNAKTERQKQALNARGSATNITGWALDPV